MGKKGLEPSRLSARDPKSRLSASSSTSPAASDYKPECSIRQHARFFRIIFQKKEIIVSYSPSMEKQIFTVTCQCAPVLFPTVIKEISIKLQLNNYSCVPNFSSRRISGIMNGITQINPRVIPTSEIKIGGNGRTRINKYNVMPTVDEAMITRITVFLTLNIPLYLRFNNNNNASASMVKAMEFANAIPAMLK